MIIKKYILILYRIFSWNVENEICLRIILLNTKNLYEKISYLYSNMVNIHQDNIFIN